MIFDRIRVSKSKYVALIQFIKKQKNKGNKSVRKNQEGSMNLYPIYCSTMPIMNLLILELFDRQLRLTLQIKFGYISLQYVSRQISPSLTSLTAVKSYS